jgi:hypothetical protein
LIISEEGSDLLRTGLIRGAPPEHAKARRRTSEAQKNRKFFTFSDVLEG